MNQYLKINKGDEIYGFIVKKVTSLSALNAVAYEFEHKRSGARLLHIHADDQENLLSIAFRTPPRDDTGLPHILEHSVLGGSKKYPVKEPFVELLKMSMATFINAMTYPDKTVYPVASNVKKDFWNLADVYLDACFHPDISEQTLKQEGHHLDFKEPGDITSPLVVKGIVYNEMKGVYSSPDSLVSRYILHHLFPDTPYGNDSGGDPEKIPDLTFKQFESFFKNCYHPANSYIFSFGDIPSPALCKFLDTRLQAFEKISVNTWIPSQPVWETPAEASYTYPAGERDTEKGKSFLAVAWLTGSGTDPAEVFEMEILEQLLLGSAAAPLTRAVTDSHLGDDIISIGYQAGTLETFFGVGVRGSEPDRKGGLQRVIENSLKEIADKNFESRKVEAAFRQIEYRYLEIPDMYPLWLMDRAYSTWVYDADPLIFLEAEKHIENIRKRYQNDPLLFTNLLRRRFLENRHRFTLTITPERGLAKKREHIFNEKMAGKKREFSEDELKRISTEARELERLQNTPNSPENLKTLPRLKLSDIPGRPTEIPSSITKTPSGVSVIKCDLFSNGVSYLNISFDLTGLPNDLYDYLPLYCFCVSKMGAGGEDYLETAERKEAHSAGIGAGVSFIPHLKEDGKLIQVLTIRGKSLNRTFDGFLTIIKDIIFTLDFSDQKRLNDVLRQKKSRLVSGMSSGGMTKAALWGGRGASLSGCLNNRVSGVPQFLHIHSLVDGFKERAEEIGGKLESIKIFLLNRKRLRAAVTAPPDLFLKAVNVLESISREMPDEPITAEEPGFTPLPPDREALIYPSDVSYCTWRIEAVPGSAPDGPLLKVFANLLRYGYLWEEVRAKGGAYGAPVAYLEYSRAFRIASYRDPNINRTLQVFEKTIDYLKKTRWSQTQIDHAVIAAAKEDNSPIRPAGAASEALSSELIGESMDYRIWKRKRLLEATPENVKGVALRLLENAEPRICVFSGQHILEAETGAMSSPLKVEDILARVEKSG